MYSMEFEFGFGRCKKEEERRSEMIKKSLFDY
jgi:hypothetical protein